MFTRSLITGGSSPAEKARATKWDQKEYDALKVAHDSLARELEVFGDAVPSEERVSALRGAVSSKQQEVLTCGTDVELTRTKVTKFKGELSHVVNSLEHASGELRKLESVMHSAKAELQKLQQECEAQEDHIFRPFAEMLGVTSVREYEEKHLRKARERDADFLLARERRQAHTRQPLAGQWPAKKIFIDPQLSYQHQ